jgi:hypothetical protein
VLKKPTTKIGGGSSKVVVVLRNVLKERERERERAVKKERFKCVES